MYELIKYIEMCVAPHNNRKKNITPLFDRHKDIMMEYFRHYGFRNNFIEELYTKSNMPLPMLIYSPWSISPNRIGKKGKILQEGLYANRLGHIFYDPVLYKNNKVLNEDIFTLGIKPPDMLVYAILYKNKNQLIKLVADFLYRNDKGESFENE